MSTLLLDTAAHEAAPRTETASLVLVLSPVRGRDGRLRVERRAIPAGQTLTEAVGALSCARLVWNGAVVPPAHYDRIVLQPYDEVWCWPAWGDPVTPFLIAFAVGIAVSIATTALSYLLFPPTKPHVEAPDEHTFSWEGIRTAVGPGNIVPVVYGTHRIGGQLLSAYVEQFLTVVDSGTSVTRLRPTSTPATLNMLLDLGHGPIDTILTHTIELNGQPIQNFPGVQVITRLGFPNDDPITEWGETRNTFADGRELPDNSSNTDQQLLYTTTQPVTAFVLNLVFPEGLMHINGKGEKEDNTVNIAYRYKVTGTPDWSAWSVFQVSAQFAAPVRFGIRREQLASAAYDLAVNFGGVRHHDELRSKFQPILESVTEIQAGLIPNRQTARLGLRAVATDQLQGALPNVTVMVRGRRVRVGTFNPDETWTDNPAWCIMDLLTNTRYGDGIPDTDINLAAFADWAAYNDDLIGGVERRHTFNYVLDREQRVQPLLLETMGGSRTLMLKADGVWTPRPTRNDAPVMLFAWASVSNVKVTYTRDPERVNVIEARFANEEDGYEQDVMTWPHVDAWPLEQRKASVELRGVTKPSRVMRALQFELNRRRYETVQLEFDCSLEAATLQIHDIFRFSHPMPGWGMSGRVQEGSTTTTLYLDEEVTLETGVTYHVYLRYVTDETEARIVYNPGAHTTRVLQFGVPFSYVPVPLDTLWAFGAASPDGAVRLFRCVNIRRKRDTTAHVEAIAHNPSIYDEPTAVPVPTTPGLFNPLGPPPGLTFLIATELTRVQPSGASLRVVNLAWDVGALGPGLAPYGGAKVFRRTVLLSSGAGLSTAGVIDLGAISDPNDPNYNFVPLVDVRGHVLETDDFTVITGQAYLYRVVPISGRGIPNNAGALEDLIQVSGPTTPDFFPGTPRNLRLLGKAVGVLTWEGRDVHLEWDTVSDSPLFSTTFFVDDYYVQVWAPGQEYLLRATNTGGVRAFHYTLEQNLEDNLRATGGARGARRDLLFLVYAHTNTGRISLDPASITVTNPPPDMSMIIPDVVGLFNAGIIKWDQYAEPPDFDHYELHLDTVNPPLAIYLDIAIGFQGQGSNFRSVAPQGLLSNITYYTFILPYDTFGAGIASQTVSFVAADITAESLDTTPPADPTGLTLSTGTDLSDDGTIMPWVEASWTLAPESDVAGYEVHVFVEDSLVPTVFSPQRFQHTIRFNVPGNVTVRVKLLTFDKFHNVSGFSPEATIRTAGDTAPPQAPTNLTAIGSIRSIALLWTPPSDVDYAFSEVWSADTNDRATATMVGEGNYSFVHEGLGANETRLYWVRAVDTSSNRSVDFFPTSATAGVQGTAGQLNTTFISDLAATKITAGVINALVRIGVNQIELDGVNHVIGIRSPTTGNYRVLMGKLGALANQWGIRIFNEGGAVMWDLTDGATTEGISNAAVTAAKIRAGEIHAGLLRTDVAVITTAAQIAFAIIDDARITNVAATKLLAGNIMVSIGLGLGNIQLDGVNQAIRLTDANSVLRVWLGKFGGTSNSDYGLNIYNEVGDLMWHFGSGASSLGIQDLAVTRAKIAFAAIGTAQIDNAAITSAKIGDLEVNNAKIANLTLGTGKLQNNAVTEALITGTGGGSIIAGAETEEASVTWPVIEPWEQVWLVGKCVARGAGAGGVETGLFLRQDSVTGPFHDVSSTTASVDAGTVTVTAPLMVQGTYTPASTVFNKRFVLGARGTNTVDSVILVSWKGKK